MYDEHKDKTILIRFICKICFLPFRTRLNSKLARIANMTRKNFFPQKIQYGYQKTQKFVLISNPLKKLQKDLPEKRFEDQEPLHTNNTLLQDLTQDSATLTGWRRTKRSGEGKMIALYGPGISLLRYLNFPAFFEIPEFS
jgi:hypothetical protein